MARTRKVVQLQLRAIDDAQHPPDAAGRSVIGAKRSLPVLIHRNQLSGIHGTRRITSAAQTAVGNRKEKVTEVLPYVFGIGLQIGQSDRDRSIPSCQSC